MKYIFGIMVAVCLVVTAQAETNYVWRYNMDGSHQGGYKEDSESPYPRSAEHAYALVSEATYNASANPTPITAGQAVALAASNAVETASATVAGMSATLNAATNRLGVKAVEVGEFYTSDTNAHLYQMTVAGGSFVPVQVSASPEVGHGVKKKRAEAKAQSIEAAAKAIQAAGPNPGGNVKDDLVYDYLYALTASVTNIVSE